MARIFPRIEWWTLLCFLCVCGCGGPEGPVRIPLAGLISAADIPGGLNGTISLLPHGETKGPAANGLIREGLFQFTSDDGPVAGTHRVLIDVEPPRGKLDSAAEQAALQWKFEFQITVPSEPPYETDFHLIRGAKNAVTEK
ncbi:MAG: hypothetical protein R3C59_11265 [Planctomycetaceae bacterium]